MSILHTAGWHIYRMLDGRKRYEEFEAFLAWLAEITQKNDFEALLVGRECT